MASGKRKEGEKFEDYRSRLANEEKAIKHKGARVLWNSRAKGTYVIKKHGVLG